MSNPTKENLDRATKFALSSIDTLSEWSTKINKPILLEEFGMARDNWVNNGASPNVNITSSYLYADTKPITHRDQFYSAIFNVSFFS